MNPVLEKFIDRTIRRGGIYFFSGPDAIDVISDARRKGVALLGIDGFFLVGEKTEPSLEHSIDFSTAPERREDIYGAAIAFIKRKENLNLYFEIVLGD